MGIETARYTLSAQFNSSTDCFKFISSTSPQCAADWSNRYSADLQGRAELANIHPAIELLYNVTEPVPGHYTWTVERFANSRGLYGYWQIEQDSAGEDAATTAINSDAARNLWHVRKNGTVSGGDSQLGWGPFLYQVDGTNTTTSTVFKDAGWGGTARQTWDLAGTNYKNWGMRIGNTDLWKLYSILNYGDKLWAVFMGAFRPENVGTAGCTPASPGTRYSDCAETGQDGVNTFILGGPGTWPPAAPAPANNWEKAMTNKYAIKIPYTFEAKLTTSAADPVSPKMNWTKGVIETDGVTGDPPTEFLGEAGRLIILEPTTVTANQPVKFQFRNTGLGSLEIGITNIEGKVTDQGITAATKYSDVVSELDLDESIVTSLWEIKNEVDSNNKYYIFQSPADESSYLSLAELQFERNADQESWKGKWIIVKFDLQVYRNIKKAGAAGFLGGRTRIASIEDIAVAYQITSANLGSGTHTTSVT